MDSVLKEEANKNAFQTFAAGASAKSNETKKATEDKRMENQAGTQRFEVTGDNPNPWSTEEQQLLEQALKTYPASLGAERCVAVKLMVWYGSSLFRAKTLSLPSFLFSPFPSMYSVALAVFFLFS